MSFVQLANIMMKEFDSDARQLEAHPSLEALIMEMMIGKRT